MQAPYTITTKVKFLTGEDNVRDSAGDVVGWKSYEHYIRILPNVYHDKVEVWKNLPDREPIRHENVIGELGEIQPGLACWLRVIVHKNEQQMYELEIQRSANGTEFISTNATDRITIYDLSGHVGLITTGPNVPKTVFDNFRIEHFTSRRGAIMRWLGVL